MFHASSRSRLAAFLILVTTVLVACGRQEPSTVEPTAPAATEPNRTRSNAGSGPAVRRENPAWPLGHEILNQAALAAEELNAAIEQLLQTPNIENLERAQSAWRQTAAQIEQFHIFSRLGTVAPQLFHPLLDLQFNLSAWPIQPGYLDSYGEHPYSGIIFDVDVPMTAEVLREQHGMTDNGDATLGLYALEFLLFGEQNQRGPLVFQPITALNEKYLADGFENVAELPRNRRRELLRLQSRILADDVARLQNLWSNPQPDQVKYHFETLESSQQAELLQKAALALVTEQLVTLANQQAPASASTSANDLWQNQQLADRLTAQLVGLQRLHQVVPLGTAVAEHIQRSIATFKAVAALPPLTEQGLPTRANWQEAYRALRELVRALNPGEPAENAAQ